VVAAVAAAAHAWQHGLRTVYAGPQALWNADISANDWLMQVLLHFTFPLSIRIQFSYSHALDLQHELLRIFCPQSGVQSPLRSCR